MSLLKRDWLIYEKNIFANGLYLNNQNIAPQF